MMCTYDKDKIKYNRIPQWNAKHWMELHKIMYN